MIKIFASYLVLISIMHGICIGQDFEKIVIDDENGVYNGKCRWFDYDNDSDLDFIITGQVSTNTLRLVLYENIGDDQFKQVYTSQGFSETGVEFVNLDQDHDVDFILNGRSIGVDNDFRTFRLEYGEIEIVDNIIPDYLSGGGYGALIYADVNNDLLQDLFVSGINGYADGKINLEANFYWQNDDQTFDFNSSLSDAIYLGDAVLFDADNDHDLDLFISGSDNIFPYQRTELHLNTNGSFALDDKSTFTQLQNTSIDVGDYDKDGDPDIVMIGLDSNLDPKTYLYENVDGVFTEVAGTGLGDRNGVSGAVMWGDFDNDNDLDLLLGGKSDGDYNFEVMVNQGDGTFEHLDETNFENLSFGSVAWGDYDGDGDLDILASGYEDVEDPKIIVYKNNKSISAMQPEVPDNLAVAYEDESVILSWNEQSAVRSLSNSAPITYNLSVERTEEVPILFSFSDLGSGFRKIVSKGNMGYATSWEFRDLKEGIYQWRVQSVSPAYKGSAFSEVSFFYIGIPDQVPSSLTAEIENQGIGLSWVDTNSNEEYFIIERRVSNEEGFVKIDSTSSDVISFLDKAADLAPTFNAIYKVYAKNPNGSSDYSQNAQIWQNGKPTDLTLGQIGNGVALAWEDHSINEDEFIIERREEGEEEFEAIGSVKKDVTIFIDEDKSDGYTATYRVYASNEHGDTDTSKEESITVLDVEKQRDRHWSIYPNPASDLVTIKLATNPGGSLKVRLLNTAGKVVKIENLKGVNMEMSVAELNNGIYYLSIAGIPTIKLIKQ